VRFVYEILRFGSFMAALVLPSRAPVILFRIADHQQFPDSMIASVRNSGFPHFTVTLPPSMSLQAMWPCSRDSTLFDSALHVIRSCESIRA
jgi:hypothetical protein